MRSLPPAVRLLRPHQYAKNLLVFSAPGAAGRLDEGRVVGLTLASFALFCAVSSAGYVLNDLLDAEADRRHPLKRHRPIANGTVSSRQAVTLLTVLGAGAMGLSLVIDLSFGLVLCGYAALTASYSIRLKRVPWLELLAVSAGFLLRAVAGGVISDTPISGWFLLVVSSGALLLITGKRLGELITLGVGIGSRAALAGYSIDRLRRLATVSSILAVGGYATWAAAEAGDRAADSEGSLFLRLTAVAFGVAILRYLALSWRGSGETPESLIIRDRVVLAAGFCWATLYAIGIYA